MSSEHVDKIREYLDPTAIRAELGNAVPSATLDPAVEAARYGRISTVFGEIDTALGGVARARELADRAARNHALAAEPLVPKTANEFLVICGEQPFSLSFYGTDPNKTWLIEHKPKLLERYGPTTTYSRAFNSLQWAAHYVTPPLRDPDQLDSALWEVALNAEGMPTELTAPNRRHFFEWATGVTDVRGSRNMGPGLAHAALNMIEIQAGNIDLTQKI